MTRKEAKRLGNSMKLDKCTKEIFQKSISSNKEDSFARTFISKADMQNLWDRCIGAFDENGDLMGAIITTVGKYNKVANLQLLHTFFKHRKKGVAKYLVNDSVCKSVEAGALYYRVSSEIPSVEFYEKCGFKFWGKQKSGCSLSIFRLNGKNVSDGIYDIKDPIIFCALFGKKKGSIFTPGEMMIKQQKENIESLWTTD